MELLKLAIVHGYSFENILRLFKLCGVPKEYYAEHDGYPRCSKTVLVNDTINPLHEGNTEDILLSLIEEVVVHATFGPQYPKEGEYLQVKPKLIRSLELGGYKIENDKIVRLMDDDVVEEETLLEKTLKSLGLDIVLHHLNMSYKHFSEGDWDSANGQTRKTLEALTEFIAEEIAKKNGKRVPTKYGKPNPSEIRYYLKNKGFLNEKEYDLLRTFYGYASETGAHSGLSDETDARIRRIIAIGLCQFYLEKFQHYAT